MTDDDLREKIDNILLDRCGYSVGSALNEIIDTVRAHDAGRDSRDGIVVPRELLEVAVGTALTASERYNRNVAQGRVRRLLAGHTNEDNHG